MYPWNSNCNHNLTSFPGQVNIQHRPSLFNNDMNNPNFSKVFDDLPPPSSAHFPSPYIPCEEAVNDLPWHQLYDLSYLQQQQQQQTLTTTAETAVIVSNMADPKKDDPVNNGGGKNTTPPQITTTTTTRKRSSKKDRHSKINTAHGPRDRRMRLSLEVARKFFDLQDMLGFDKASKTVDWLLIQSSVAIKEIMGSAGSNMPGMSNNGANSVSSTSEGEGVSGIDDSTTTMENQQQQGSVSTKAAVNTKQSKCNKEQKVARRSAFHRFARESRKIARERARKRTLEKKIRQGQVQATTTTTMDNNNNNNLNRLGSSCWTQFDQATEESGNQGPKISSHSSYELGQTTEVEEVLSSRDQHLLETIEYAADDSLVITGNWNTSTICNFHQNAEISHQHHFSEIDQYCSKPWEACNNI